MSNITINTKNATIELTKTFSKNAAKYGSPAYIELQNARKDYPTYTVEQRHIKRNTEKECYRGLTYTYMEEYIEMHADAAAHRKEYDELRLLAKCHSVRYPTIKAWFLTTYPEVAQFGMISKEIQEVPLTEAA